MSRGATAASIVLGVSLLLSPGRAAAADAAQALASLQLKSGGVGAEGREAPPGFRARLIFANPEGEYLANVRVIFRMGKFEREGFSEGPWLWVRGEPGRYEVEARAGGASARGVLALPPEGAATLILRLR